MTIPAAEKAYEKYAWVLLLLLPLGILSGSILLSLVPIPSDSGKIRLAGLTWNQMLNSYPNVAPYVIALERAIGAGELIAGTLAVVLVVVPFRRGERWAWYIAWTLPLFPLLDIDYAVKLGYWPVNLVEFLLPLSGLVLSYRKFFPKKQTAASRI